MDQKDKSEIAELIKQIVINTDALNELKNKVDQVDSKVGQMDNRVGQMGNKVDKMDSEVEDLKKKLT